MMNGRERRRSLPKKATFEQDGDLPVPCVTCREQQSFFAARMATQG